MEYFWFKSGRDGFPEVVFKPPYAAKAGNAFVGDKEKRKQRFPKVFIAELNASEPMKKPRKANYDVKSWKSKVVGKKDIYFR